MDDARRTSPDTAPDARWAHEEPPTISADMLEAPRPRDTRIDFERGMSAWPIVTLCLIALNVAVFVWQLSAGALNSVEALIAAGALHRESLLAGQWWRLFTPIALHGGLDHLIGNCIILYIVGMACEHAYGRTRMLAAYLASGLAGSVLSVIMAPGPSVGASGAIFGIIGCVILFLYRYQHLVHVRDKRIGFILLVWVIWQLATGFLSEHIDNWAHIGGLIGGTLTAWTLSPRLVASFDCQPATA